MWEIKSQSGCPEGFGAVLDANCEALLASLWVAPEKPVVRSTFGPEKVHRGPGVFFGRETPPILINRGGIHPASTLLGCWAKVVRLILTSDRVVGPNKARTFSLKSRNSGSEDNRATSSEQQLMNLAEPPSI